MIIADAMNTFHFFKLLYYTFKNYYIFLFQNLFILTLQFFFVASMNVN